MSPSKIATHNLRPPRSMHDRELDHDNLPKKSMENNEIPRSSLTERIRHVIHDGVADGHENSHHISHSVALTAEVIDPATAQHLIEQEEQWIKEESTESTISSTQLPVGPSEKNDMTIDEEEKAAELERTQSKASLAIMMANFPDGGKWAWFALTGATLIAFSTFGIPRSRRLL
jgi:hypothetical protein